MSSGTSDEPRAVSHQPLLEPHAGGVWRYARRQGDAVRLLVGSIVFTISAALAAGGDLPWEDRLFRWFNGWPNGLFWPIWWGMQFGTLVTVPVAVVLALAFGHRRLAVNLGLSGVGAYLLALLAKFLVDRPRPAGVLHDVTLRHMSPGGLGFPSGHAAVATALAVAVFPYLTRPGRIAVWSGAVIVSAARMYVGAHFPLDVLGGAALGTMVGSLVHLMMGAPIERGRHRWFLRGWDRTCQTRPPS